MAASNRTWRPLAPKSGRSQAAAAAGPQAKGGTATQKEPVWANLWLPIQRSLKVNQPGDQYEQEAEQVAEQVMRMPAAAGREEEVQQQTCACGKPLGPDGMCEECKRKQRAVQRAAAGEGAASEGVAGHSPPATAPPIVHQALQQPGRPLDSATRYFMESRFSHDFGRVRVHTDGASASSAESVDARAYTVGQELVFNQGEYRPETATGKRLLAHELTHVVQQSMSSQHAGLLQRQPALAEPSPSTLASCRIHFVQGTTEFTNAKEFARCMEIIRGYLKGGDEARTVALHGYASEEGQETFNQELSQQRADIVRLLLGQGGIPRAKIKTFGHGPDATYPGLETNRRVEIVLSETANLPADEIKPFAPTLPEPQAPEEAPGPKAPHGHILPFCQPFASKLDALVAHMKAKVKMTLFTEKFGSDVQDIWLTYLDTPKIGTKGTLPPRRLFGDQQSRVVREFREDPETLKQRGRIIKLIAERVRNDPTLLPAVGETSEFQPYRNVLGDQDLLDLPMAFKDPFNRIPGLLAGGFGKNSSDAGDDVRNVDGQFRVTNQGGGTFRIQDKFVFDILDAIDFCPGAAGGPAAELGVTVQLSRLEATPDIPTYDTPFEVVVGGSDDQIFTI